MSEIKFFMYPEYVTWYGGLTAKIRAQIDSRLQKIRYSEHYGHTRKLTSVLFELKFNNGNRIYCTEKRIDGRIVILILGGNKHGQEKDFRKAQKIAERIHSDQWS